MNWSALPIEMQNSTTNKTLICLFDRFEIRYRFVAAGAGSHEGSMGVVQ
jgi:hypothetical protein